MYINCYKNLIDMIKIIYGNCTYNFQYDNKNSQKSNGK